MAVTDLSSIINIMTGGGPAPAQHPTFFFDARVQANAAAPTLPQQFTSLWRYNKSNGANGAIPSGTATICDNTTLGALPIVNPSGGRKLYLIGMELASRTSGVLQLYDRLAHVSGLNTVITSVQPINLTINRNTGGIGNEIWVEIYASPGTSLGSIRANYTNQDGVAKTTADAAIGGTNLRETDRIIKLILAAGDTGVRSVESIQIGVSTGSLGNIGVTIANPIAMTFNEQGGSAAFRDYISGIPTLPEIQSGACLSFLWLPPIGSSTSTSGQVVLHIIET